MDLSGITQSARRSLTTLQKLGWMVKIHLPLKTIQRWCCLVNRSRERCCLTIWMHSCLLFNEDSKYAICAHCKSKNINPGAWESGIVIHRHKRKKYTWKSGRGWNNLWDHFWIQWNEDSLVVHCIPESCVVALECGGMVGEVAWGKIKQRLA